MHFLSERKKIQLKFPICKLRKTPKQNRIDFSCHMIACVIHFMLNIRQCLDTSQNFW